MVKYTNICPFRARCNKPEVLWILTAQDADFLVFTFLKRFYSPMQVLICTNFVSLQSLFVPNPSFFVPTSRVLTTSTTSAFFMPHGINPGTFETFLVFSLVYLSPGNQDYYLTCFLSRLLSDFGFYTVSIKYTPIHHMNYIAMLCMQAGRVLHPLRDAISHTCKAVTILHPWLHVITDLTDCACAAYIRTFVLGFRHDLSIHSHDFTSFTLLILVKNLHNDISTR